MRQEDAPLLRGAARYVGDLRHGPASEHPRLTHAPLHAVFVRSTQASALVRSIDIRDAQAMPGVIAVARAGELGLPMRGPLPGMGTGVERPLFAHEVVRHVGEIVDLDARPLVVNPYDALRADAPRVHASMPSNAYLTGRFPVGAPIASLDVFAGADVVASGEFVTQRVAAAPMEPNGALAVPGEPHGGVTLWASTQFVHGVRREVAELLELAPEQVRVVIPQVGGGFGPKFETAPEYVAVAALARHLGRAVRWQETRSECLVTMPHGRGHHQKASLGLRRDGTFTGLHVRVATDAGAYPIAGAGSPVGTGVLMVPGPYLVTALDVEVSTVATNTPPVGVYRGPGRAEPNYMRERLIDIAAADLGIDPVELRRRNLIPVEQMPYRSPTGFLYDTGDYHVTLDEALRVVDYPAMRAAQATRRTETTGRALGIGVSCWLDVTPRNRAGEYASLTVVPTEDGGVRVDVLAGTCDHGQGHATSWGLVLSGVLGVPLESVHLVPADTEVVPRGDGTGSARSLQLVASSLTVAGRVVLEQAKAIAAHLLEADARDLVLDDDRIVVVGSPTRGVGWFDIASAAQAPHALPPEVAALVPEGHLGAAADVDQEGPTFPFGVHVAVVEVDIETGDIEIVRFVAVDDCGLVVNPVVVEGQQHGGIAQGIAQALFEHAEFATDGTPLASSFLTYLVPSAADLPALDVRTIGLPTPRNIIGSKGIGQGGAIGAPAAVVNAVVDALAPYGVRHIDMPLSPERVRRAMGAL
jgi:carbon-monoxide dehydrogenase large subunit